MAPKDENELRQMIYSAFTYNNPVAVRYPRANGLGVTLEEKFALLPQGQAELLREGKDLTLIVLGRLFIDVWKLLRNFNLEELRPEWLT
jgi:1-deoxy-D-xylulose-5-phosphate synthase